jgi:aminoglycoside 3-N-acetyltransferase
MLTLDDFTSALKSLDLGKKPAIAHASLRSFGAIRGGAETVLNALLPSLSGLIMPAFTYKTMITPEVGPPHNGLTYGSGRDLNLMALPFRYTMRVDPMIGMLPEILRYSPGARRTSHPILSFVSARVNDALVMQTMNDPLALIGWMSNMDGWVLLLGVDHTVNTSIHYGEKLAGRRQFVRWAWVGKRIVECPGFPNCSDGFEAIRPDVQQVTRRAQIGEGFIEAIPLQALLQTVEDAHQRNDPLALLCQRDTCERCDAIRVIEK